MTYYPYFKLTPRSRLDKSINTLLGLIEGITIDKQIDQREIQYLMDWTDEHADLIGTHPMNDLLPRVAKAIADGALTEEEALDIQWACTRLRSTEYYNVTTADLQRLQAIVAGISADSLITEAELHGLAGWISDHDDLRTCWPYDEIDSLITTVLADQHIDPNEHTALREFFAEFVTLESQLRPEEQPTLTHTIAGICAISPEITFDGHTFCFTGEGRRTREEYYQLILSHGGKTRNNISPKLNYLIVGSAGNPCWSYCCYGRKIEEVMNLRKQGHAIVIAHENDFLDAI